MNLQEMAEAFADVATALFEALRPVVEAMARLADDLLAVVRRDPELRARWADMVGGADVEALFDGEAPSDLGWARAVRPPEIEPVVEDQWGEEFEVVRC